MEECEKEQPSVSFQQELRNISQLQEQIERTKKELSQLLKIEHNEEKSLEGIYRASVVTTRNKLNLWQNHESQEHLH
jgi:vacuolar-type H+-ATPase subunit I/STV1